MVYQYCLGVPDWTALRMPTLENRCLDRIWWAGFATISALPIQFLRATKGRLCEVSNRILLTLFVTSTARHLPDISEGEGTALPG